MSARDDRSQGQVVRRFWGHAIIPSWYSEASLVLDLDGNPRPLAEEQQIAESTVGADGFPVSRR